MLPADPLQVARRMQPIALVLTETVAPRRIDADSDEVSGNDCANSSGYVFCDGVGFGGAVWFWNWCGCLPGSGKATRTSPFPSASSRALTCRAIRSSAIWFSAC